MKRCPTCHRNYEDSQSFCVEDGTTLEMISESEFDPNATILAPGNMPPTRPYEDPRATNPPDIPSPSGSAWGAPPPASGSAWGTPSAPPASGSAWGTPSALPSSGSAWNTPAGSAPPAPNYNAPPVPNYNAPAMSGGAPFDLNDQAKDFGGKIKYAAIGGAAAGLLTGVLSLVPIISLSCCLWGIGGGVLSAMLYINSKPPLPVNMAEGAIVGGMSGLIAAIVSLIIALPVTIIYYMAFLNSSDIGTILAGSILGLILRMAVLLALGLGGGILAVNLFEKRNK